MGRERRRKSPRPTPTIPRRGMVGSAVCREPVMASTNTEIAERLYRAAELMELQGASPFRVLSYRRA